MLKSTLFTGIALLCLGGGPAYAYDISDAVSSAMENNDAIKIGKEKLEITKLGQAKEFTGFMPSVTYSSQYMDTDLVPPIPRDRPDLADLQTKNSIGSQQQYFTVTQNLFQGGTTFYGIKGARENSASAQDQYQQEVSELLLDSIKIYQGVIAARSSYVVAVQKEDSTRKIYEQVEIKLETGVATKTMLAEAKANLAGSIAAKEKSLSDLKNAEAQFVQIIGDYPPEDMVDIDQNALQLPASFDEFLESIEDTNLDILAAQHNHQASRYEVLKSVGVLMPSVNFTLTSQKQLNEPIKYTGDTYIVSVNVPIFQKGIEYVGLKEAKLRERLAQYGLQNTTAATITKAITSWNTYQQSKVSLVAYEEALEYQKFYLDGSKMEFEIGTKSLKDLLDAEVSYATRQNEVISTKLNLVVSAFTIRYILGDIDAISMLRKDKSKKN